MNSFLNEKKKISFINYEGNRLELVDVGKKIELLRSFKISSALANLSYLLFIAPLDMKSKYFIIIHLFIQC